MKNIIHLLFQAKMLKEIPRSGYSFLGAGKESVAEHSFITAFIAYTISQVRPDVDAMKLITMCLVHDLPESSIGDLNYVQKRYVMPNEDKAIADATKDIPFGDALSELIQEFNKGKSEEAKLAHDADQLALILELKSLSDIGYATPQKWIPSVLERLKTDTGKKLSENILKTEWDEWWLKHYSNTPYKETD